MDKISIGEIIFKLRKKKKITQEELGNYIGVSTAAVSKWESGNSYPDITFLPVLAAFFEVSIDELLNYKVELSEEEANKIFAECIKLFRSDDFYNGISKSEEYIEKYKSSYLLKLKLACLFRMYLWKISDEEMIKKINMRIKTLFEEVVQNSDKEELVERALYQLSSVYSSMGREEEAIEALNKIRKSEFNVDVMLANIYIKNGDLKKGREIFQSELYKNICFSDMIFSALAESYVKKEKDLKSAERYLNLSIDVKKAFLVDGKSVLSMWSDYLGLASIYLKFNERKKAVNMLCSMLEDLKCNNVSEFNFNSIWYFSEITEKGKMPINTYEILLKRLEKSEFDLIREENEFKNIVNELRNLKEGSALLG
ncbi:helix-turn-helix domain-containing protein [Clostridium hydrogenum]|uniref:helix-turn-helix domain-containing protein n=1 Tax=Clostridium hydrogenum TaxID=2855764 RepID=UPI001F44A575|nr:helix-turn-helix transcriptional regulator [Clostridium hydrogenum]